MVSKAKATPVAPVAPEATTDVAALTVGKVAGANCPPSMAAVKYTIRDGAPYNPRVTHTQEAWVKLQKAFGTSGVATHQELCDALAVHFTRTDENHHDFIGYMVRRKAISIVVAK